MESYLHASERVSLLNPAPEKCLFKEPFICGFLAESAAAFSQHHKNRAAVIEAKEDSGDRLLPPSKLLDQSRKYRSILLNWKERFQLEIEKLKIKAEDSRISEDAKEEITQDQYVRFQAVYILKDMIVAWQLFELLYIDVRSPFGRMLQLKEWLNESFTDYVSVANEVVAFEPMHGHEKYWDAIISLVLSGDLNYAALFLSAHPVANVDPTFKKLLVLMRTCPEIGQYSRMHEYFLKFEDWRDNVLDTIRNCEDEFNAASPLHNIKLILYIIAGDIEAFKTVKHLCPHWYNLMVSFLLYADPCLKQFKLPSICDEFRKMCRGQEVQDDLFDNMIRQAFDYKLNDCVLLACEYFQDNAWFVTHFVDLIHGSSLEEELQANSRTSLRKFILGDYATFLSDHPSSLWTMAIEYIEQLDNSKNLIRTLLQNNLKDSIKERDYERMLLIAKRKQLVDVEMSIYRHRAKLAHRGRDPLVNCLFWSIKAKNMEMIDFQVDKFLKNYMKSASEAMKKNDSIVGQGALIASEFILKLPSNWAGLSDKLGFLFKYYDYHRMVAQQQYQEAVKSLVEMLTLRAVPRYFQLQVMLDIVMLMKFDGLEFSRDDVITILDSFEQVSVFIKQMQAPIADVWGDDDSDDENVDSTNVEDGQLFLQQFHLLREHEHLMRTCLIQNNIVL